MPSLLCVASKEIAGQHRPLIGHAMQRGLFTFAVDVSRVGFCQIPVWYNFTAVIAGPTRQGGLLQWGDPEGDIGRPDLPPGVVTLPESWLPATEDADAAPCTEVYSIPYRPHSQIANLCSCSKPGYMYLLRSCTTLQAQDGYLIYNQGGCTANLARLCIVVRRW